MGHARPCLRWELRTVSSSSFEPFDGVLDQGHDLLDVRLKRPDLEGSDAQGAKTTPHRGGQFFRDSNWDDKGSSHPSWSMMINGLDISGIMSAEFPRLKTDPDCAAP